MAVVFNALFGSAQSKTAGTSLNINPADITVAAGDDIFLAYAGDDVGSAFGVTHGGTAAITWTLEKEKINAGNAKAQLWRGAVTAGGTLTNITISWTTNVTAKAAVAGWYSGVGTRDDTSSSTNTGARGVVASTVTNPTLGGTVDDTCEWQIDDLVIGCKAHEGPNSDVQTAGSVGSTWSSGPTLVGQNGTTGGGGASNISAALVHGIASSDETTASEAFLRADSNSGDNANAGAVYSPAGAANTFLNVDPGSYALSGIAAGIPVGRVALSSPGSYALSGSAAAVPAGRVLIGIPGSYVLTGIDVAFAAPFAILADPGSYALTGAVAAAISDHILGTEVGGYAVTGEVATVVAGRAVSADPGTYVLAGTAAALIANRILSADLGTYVITGIAADLSLTGVFSINALPGSYALSGMDALLVSDRVLVAAPGVYVVSGQSATLIADRILSLDPGSYVLTGFLADLVLEGTFEIAANSGIYTITGIAADLEAQLIGGTSMGGMARPSRHKRRDEEDEMIALILSRM